VIELLSPAVRRLAAPIQHEPERTLAGLPLRAGLAYVLLFAIAMGAYPLVWRDAPLVEPDTESYMRGARDLADFHLDELQERPPGYPLLLLATHSSQRPTRELFVISLILHCLCVWALGTLLHRAGLGSAQLVLFGLIMTLPPYVEAAGYVLSESMTEVTLVLAFIAIVRWTTTGMSAWMLLGALAMGYAALTRPAYQLLSFGIAGCLAVATFAPGSTLRGRTVLMGAALLVATSSAVVGAYAFLNYQKFGHFVITPKFGITLSTKTFSVVERLPDEYAPIRAALLKARIEEIATVGTRAASTSIWRAVPDLQRITGLSGAELSNYMLKVNLRLIRTAPLGVLQEVVTAGGTYWLPSSGALANFKSPLLQLLWAVIHFAVLGVFATTLLLLLGGGVSYLSVRRRLSMRAPSWHPLEDGSIEGATMMYALAGTIVFYTAVVSCVVEIGIPRYRVPTDGFIVFMTFLGVVLWRQLIQRFAALWMPMSEDVQSTR